LVINLVAFNFIFVATSNSITIIKIAIQGTTDLTLSLFASITIIADLNQACVIALMDWVEHIASKVIIFVNMLTFITTIAIIIAIAIIITTTTTIIAKH